MDRASMANSVEIRAPFLDKNLIQFAFTQVPSNLKVNNHDQKILLKKLASKILPASFDINRKHGFAIPLVNFLHESKWQDYFHQTITDSNCKLINKENCLKLMKDKNTTYQNAGRLFGLIFFIHWVKRFSIDC
jgi:asparagine synthase (glutamine-hydrolysing)